VIITGGLFMKAVFMIFISLLFASSIYAQTKIAKCSEGSGGPLYFIFYDEQPTSANIIIANNISAVKEVIDNGYNIPTFTEEDLRITDNIKKITKENSFLYKNEDYRILLKSFEGDSFEMEYQQLFKATRPAHDLTCKYIK
jgi:hypothetical protein